MKLVIGLGNPEIKYRNNRHNVGYLVVNELLKSKLPSGMAVAKSEEFMNSSGQSVRRLLASYHANPADLYIIHDDLDIRLGDYKIQFGKGPKLHGGIRSIETELGTPDFWRVRVGVDNRDENRVSGEEYVLQDFTDEEKGVLNSVIERIKGDLCRKDLQK